MQMVFVGILVGTVTDKMLTIDWLSVSADRQGRGIGEALLLKAFGMADIGNIPSLGAVLSPELVRDGLMKGAEMSVPSEALFRNFIPEISFLFLTDEEASGALILQRCGEYLMPVYFYAESERESAALIIAAMREARNKFGKEQEILLKLLRGKTAALFRSIMPGLPLSRLLVASVEDYRSLKDETDQT